MTVWSGYLLHERDVAGDALGMEIMVAFCPVEQVVILERMKLRDGISCDWNCVFTEVTMHVDIRPCYFYLSTLATGA